MLTSLGEGLFGQDQLFKEHWLKNVVSRFTDQYTDLKDPGFVALEPEYKRKIAFNVQTLLSQESLADLITQGQFEEAKVLIKRACSGTFDGQPNNLLNQWDRQSIENAPGEQLTTLLYELLYGTDGFSERFESWVDLLAREKPSVWPAATYFLMMRYPQKYIFVKPEPFDKLLKALRSNVKRGTLPTYLGYTRLMMLSTALLSRLEPLGARDMIDVQSFIYALFPTPK